MPIPATGYPDHMAHDDTTTPDDADETEPGTGSGRGGSLGTPSGLPEEAPPSADQEANEAVSGGGMVQPSTEGPGMVDPTEGEPRDSVDKD